MSGKSRGVDDGGTHRAEGRFDDERRARAERREHGVKVEVEVEAEVTVVAERTAAAARRCQVVPAVGELWRVRDPDRTRDQKVARQARPS